MSRTSPTLRPGEETRAPPPSERSRRTHAWVLLGSMAALAVWAGLLSRAREPPPSPPPERGRFRAELVSCDTAPAIVRPGDPLSFRLRFTNTGSAPAECDHAVFVHFESAAHDCSAIAFQGDHRLWTSTDTWVPGDVIDDGPRLVRVPEDVPDGEYHVHVGLFDLDGDQHRALEASPGIVRVDRSAPASSAWMPEPLARADLEERRAALATRLVDPVAIEGTGWRFALDRASGAWQLDDLASGVAWTSDPRTTDFGRVLLAGPEQRLALPIRRFDRVAIEAGALVAEAEIGFRGLALARVALRFTSFDAGKYLRIEPSVAGLRGWNVVTTRLLDHALATTDAEEGWTVAPAWLGQILRCDAGLPGDRRYGHDDVTMAMTGASKDGSVLLCAWSDPLGFAIQHFSLEDHPRVAGRRVRSVSLEIAGTGQELFLAPLGRGDHVDIARAYRPLAERRGLRTTRAERRAADPSLELLDGAAVFRFTCLVRSVTSSRLHTGQGERSEVLARFADVEACARHWREELGIDRAHVLIAGWNSDGYDRGHPDVLPANPECGGDEGLAQAVCAVDGLGFVVSLHENYSDMYAETRSWDPDAISRGEAGEMRGSGEWFGGTAFRVCPVPQRAFARRNLAELGRRFGPRGMYFDTTLTPQLAACSDPVHPLTREGDLAARSALFADARRRFGLLGLEGGREWAVPLADWFEGILTHKTIHRPGWVVVPLFPAVYGDCVDLVPIQADKLGVADARKVLDLALYAQMPSYAFGRRRYYEAAGEQSIAVRVKVLAVEQSSERRFRLRERFTVGRDVDRDLGVFVHFVDDAARGPEGIVFQSDHRLARPSSSWRAGETIEQWSPWIALPPAAGDGPWRVELGMTTDGTRRVPLEEQTGEDGRYGVGSLERAGGRFAFVAELPDAARLCFSRADGGWAEHLGPTDRTIKNTYEVLSWIDRLTAGRALSAHRFLRPDGSAEETLFGDLVVRVNYGPEPLEVGGTTLPRFGLLVESPRFVAFHATRHAGVDSPGGALFTLRSQDGLPLERSRSVRVFHGFGPPEVRVGERVVRVEREALIDPRGE